MSNITQYIKEAQDMNPDRFAMDIVDGIFREARKYEGENGDILKEALARVGAMLSTLIETSQKTCKSGNTFELEGVLGAFRFRYCDTQNGEGN